MFCSNGLNWDTACSLHHGLQHISHYWLLLGFDRMHLKSSIVDLTKGDPPNGSRAQPTHVFHHCSSPPIWSTQPILQAEIHNQPSRLKTHPALQTSFQSSWFYAQLPGAMFGHSNWLHFVWSLPIRQMLFIQYLVLWNNHRIDITPQVNVVSMNSIYSRYMYSCIGEAWNNGKLQTFIVCFWSHNWIA